MPRRSEDMNKHGPRNRTRRGRVKPKVPKAWYGKVKMRALAKVLDRFDETVEAFEIRQTIRDEKRERPYCVRLKAIRERRQAEALFGENCRRNASALKRDGNGRFVPKPSRSES